MMYHKIGQLIMDIDGLTNMSSEKPQAVEKRTDEGSLSNKIEQMVEKLGSIDVKSWYIRGDAFEMLGEHLNVIKDAALRADKLERELGIYNLGGNKLLLKRLKVILDDVVQLLDEFSTVDLRCKNKKNKRFQDFFSSSNKVVFSFKMVIKIKELTKRMENLENFIKST
ncbi:hypothetical protein TSUD_367280 [Trifolium subterraneum]|uniref:Rx N-terminal domain-containing protein n=1 Tax=Trifolium subterraneum TaxID=3900 RepID=A0A2Z6NYS4_TRISU|nr:hypothetical protein TSUD_367280 [Trifolium subterraneum]